MYITFDYKCPLHGIESRFVRRSEMDDQRCHQLDHEGRLCRRTLLRLPPGTRTTFRHADTHLKR